MHICCVRCRHGVLIGALSLSLCPSLSLFLSLFLSMSLSLSPVLLLRLPPPGMFFPAIHQNKLIYTEIFAEYTELIEGYAS